MAPQIPNITLRDGTPVPQVGFGTWQSKPQEVEKAVEVAIKAGYRHLDLAKVYQNQEEVRAGIAKAGVPRSELFLTSKLWNNFHRPENVAAGLEDTLKELGTDYLDLYLIHWPVPFKPTGTLSKELFPQKDGVTILDDGSDGPSVIDTWKAVLELKKSGKVKNVGVSNFSVEAIEALGKATGELPAVHQIERHPLLIQPELIKHHAANKIHITAYSGLGNNTINVPLLIENETIKAVAEKHGATPAQVLISWGTVGGHTIIPKSVTASRIESNLASLDAAPLDADDIKKINAIGDNPRRYNIPATYKPKWDINVFGEKEEEGTKASVKF